MHRQISSATIALLMVLIVGQMAGSVKEASATGWRWWLNDPPGPQLTIEGQGPIFAVEQIAAGDVNGDGVADLVVANPHALDSAPNAWGTIHILPGPLPASAAITMPSPVALALVNGEASATAPVSSFGGYLATGDLNSDAFDDVVIGNWAISTTYVYLGNAAIQVGAQSTHTVTSETMALTVHDANGGVVICNINGDAYDDLFVRSVRPNAEANGNQVQISGLLGHGGITTTMPTQISAYSPLVDVVLRLPAVGFVSLPGTGDLGCGDVDGDGVDDLVIGSPWESPGGRAFAGRLYVVRGSHSFIRAQPHVLQLPADAGITLEGIDGGRPFFIGSGDRFGGHIAVADLNLDGRADLVVAAPGSHGRDNALQNAGEIYVWFGRSLHGEIANIGEQAAWTIGGNRAGAHLGYLLQAGDLSGDAYPEIIVSCNCEPRPPGWLSEPTLLYVLESKDRQSDGLITEVASVVVMDDDEPVNFGPSLLVLDHDNDGKQGLALSARQVYFEPDKIASWIYVVEYPVLSKAFLPFVSTDSASTTP